MRQLSTGLRKEIVLLLSQGKGIRKLAEKFNISKSTVGNILKEFLPNHISQKKRAPI